MSIWKGRVCCYDVDEGMNYLMKNEMGIVKQNEDFSWATADDMLKTDVVVHRIYAEKFSIEKGILLQSAIRRAAELGIGEAFMQYLSRYEFVQKYNQDCSERTLDFPGFEQKGEIRVKAGRWICNENGVYLLSSNAKTDQYEFACHNPIMPVRRYYDVVTKTEMVQLCFYSDNEWTDIVVPRAVLANRTKVVDLARYGILVDSSSAKRFVEYMTEFFALNDEWLQKINTISRLGRYGDDFLPYTEGVQYSSQDGNDGLYHALMSQKGTVQEWVDFVWPQMKKYMPLRLYVAASLASVLIEPLEAQSFIFYVWGSTELGKSVGMKVAMSVWGDPHPGMLIGQLNSTINAMMYKLAKLYSFPCAYDEAQSMRDSLELIEKAIMTFCEQIGRERCDVNGVVQLIETWKNLLILNGEETLTKHNFGGGAINRVLEVEVKEKMIDDGYELTNFVYNHHGMVGRHFIEQLLQSDIEPLRKLLSTFAEKIRNNADTMNKQVQSAAMLALGDYLFQKFILDVDEPEMDEVIEALQACCKTKSEVDVAVRAQQEMEAWLQINYRNFYNASLKIEAPAGSCYGKIQGDKIYVVQSVFVKALREYGFDFSAVKERMCNNGFMCRFQDKSGLRYTKNTSIHKMQVTCVVLSPKFDRDENNDHSYMQCHQ